MAKAPGKRRAKPEIELDPDAWPRFEQFVKDAAKAGPQHREAKPKRKKRGTKPAIIAFVLSAASLLLPAKAQTPNQPSEPYRRMVADCAYRYLVQTGQIMLPSGTAIPQEAFLNAVNGMPGILWGNSVQDDCINVASTVLGMEKSIDSLGR